MYKCKEKTEKMRKLQNKEVRELEQNPDHLQEMTNTMPLRKNEKSTTLKKHTDTTWCTRLGRSQSTRNGWDVSI